MPTWDQKRAQIAQALAGGGGAGWAGFGQSLGAGLRANPMLRWGNQGNAAPEMAGQTQGQQMAQANASLQGAPGFDYVPPLTGPAPVPAAAPGQGGAMSLDDVRALILGGANPEWRPGFSSGQDRGGYSTSGRGGGRSSSWGGAQRGGGGLY